MRRLHNLQLYTDVMGHPVTTPVMQVGSGKPHVVMVALQHGWEIIGLDTALQVMRDCKPKGTITLISVASPLAYHDGGRITGAHLGPSSKQATNMNRVHPGDPEGNIAERSAWAIDQYIQSLKPDFVIDLHSYASQSVPHCIVDDCGEPTLQKRIESWVTDSKNVWYREYEGSDLTGQALDKALSAIWVNRGIPTITLELGHTNLFSPGQSEYAQQALGNVLIACQAITGRIVPHTNKLLEGATWQRSELIYRGDKGGYLRPIVSIVTPVAKNDVLAEVVTPDGEVVDTITAPQDGIHFIWHDEFRVASGSLLGVQLIPYKPAG